MRFERIVRRACPAAAAVALAAALVLPRPGGAQEELDVTNMMGEMETAYIDIVKALFVHPVQKPTDEPPYGEVAKRVEVIRKTAALLPRLDNYKDDKKFLVLARQLEGSAKELGGRAEGKRLADSLAALSTLLGACLKCHNDYRF